MDKFELSPDANKRWIKKNEKNKITGYRKNWIDKNKEKLKTYKEKRKEKQHDIAQDEWQHCLNYFGNSCAYCGMSMQEHIKLYNQKLHKEHVDDDGLNDITNCVPSCRVCNSKKRNRSLLEFLEYHDDFTKDKYRKILTWLSFVNESK